MSDFKNLLDKLVDAAQEMGRCSETLFWRAMSAAEKDMENARQNLAEEIDILQDRAQTLEAENAAMRAERDAANEDAIRLLAYAQHLPSCHWATVSGPLDLVCECGFQQAISNHLNRTLPEEMMTGEPPSP